MSRFLVTLLLISMDKFAFAQSVQIQPYDICGIFSGPAQFQYDAYFDQEFIQKIPPTKIQSLFSKLIQAHGDCTEVSSGNLEYSILHPSIYFFTLKDGNRAMFEMATSPNSGKINLFIYKGTIAPKWPMFIQESWVTMSDGTKLRTLVYQSGETEKSSVVLARTPYFLSENKFDAKHLSTAQTYLDHGYTYVQQAIRGTGGSEGTALLFNPQEANDAAETIAWIRQQNFSNGHIAAIGTSYEGLTALASGMKQPPGLDVIISGAGPVDSYTGTFSLNGPLNLSVLDYIYYFTTGIGIPFNSDFSEKLINKVGNELDLSKYDELLYGKVLPEWQQWATAWKNNDETFFAQRSMLGQIKNITAPVLYVAGTGTDGNMPDAIRNYLESKKSTPMKDFLVLGNWNHGNNTPYTRKPFSNLKTEWEKLFWQYLDSGFKHTLDQLPHFLTSTFTATTLISELEFPFIRPSKISFNLKNLDHESSDLIYTPGEPEAQTLIFELVPQQELLINGMMHLELYYELLNPNQNGQFFFNVLKGKDLSTVVAFNSCTSGAKIKPVSGIQKFVYDCPVFHKINKDDKIFAVFATNGFPYLAQPLEQSQIRIWHSQANQSFIRFDLESSN